MLDEIQEKTLEEIVELKGNCLTAKMCQRCPFASKCLPQMSKDRVNRPSRQERFNMALDTLMRVHIMGDDDLSYPKDASY